ncbi:hypothetical protein, partial [Paenibacillus polymyxa]|uniref:hypothetical protein n=1 Tax=Paenibacillus polymyxa TaxID=1406 RepID=UPI00298D0384
LIKGPLSPSMKSYRECNNVLVTRQMINCQLAGEDYLKTHLKQNATHLHLEVNELCQIIF